MSRGGGECSRTFFLLLTFNEFPSHSIKGVKRLLTSFSLVLPANDMLLYIYMRIFMIKKWGERTCPDTPNRKYPDIVPKGNIPTKLHNRKYPDSKIGYFLLGNRKYPDKSFDNRKCPDSKKTLSGYFLLAKRKYPDSKNIVGIFPVGQWEMSRHASYRHG
jgi:hypothetical protein